MHDKFNLVTFYVAPELLFLSSLLYIFFGQGMNNGLSGGLVQCLAMFLFIFPVLTLTSIMSAQMPRLSVLFRFLLVLGCLMGFTFGIDSILNATQPNSFSLLEMDKTISAMLWILGPIWPLCLGILGIIFWIKRILPTLPSVLLALGGFSFPLGRIPDIAIIYVFTDLFLIISFALAANSIRKLNQ